MATSDYRPDKFERTEVVIDDRSFGDACAVSITRQAGELWQMTLTLNLAAVEIQRVNSIGGSVVMATTLRAADDKNRAESAAARQRMVDKIKAEEAAKRGLDPS